MVWCLHKNLGRIATSMNLWNNPLCKICKNTGFLWYVFSLRGASKGFMKALKVFMKPSEAPQRENMSQEKPMFWHVLYSDPVVVNLVAQKLLKNGGTAFFDPRILIFYKVRLLWDLVFLLREIYVTNENLDFSQDSEDINILTVPFSGKFFHKFLN